MVLIGIPDTEIPCHHKTSSFTNKIGGIPDWPFKEEYPSPVCQLCGHSKSLVVQLYCPLECSSYHRTLYVFACPKPSCWNKTESWTVYRCQKVDTTCNQSSNQKGQLEDNHKTSNDDDWGMDANDWGDDADDWGEGSDDASHLVSDFNNVSNDKETSLDLASYNTGVTVTAERDTESEESKNSENSDVDNNAVCDDLEQMTIVEGIDNTSKVDSSVVEETMPSISEDEKSRILKSFNTTDISVEECSVLETYYINVFEEPADVFEDTKHVTKLLKDYQRNEGFNIDNVREAESSKGGEKYEKTTLLHKDVIFHKFMKKLSLCPEQCIRYEWNGAPLFNSIPRNDIPKKCIYCNGDIVFELQLTPALVNHLKFKTGVNQAEGCAIEFGTVILFTCRQSCWKDDDEKLKTENIIVLPDPDQHLFK
ncbi:programmed cell death protein [Mactra antiquata]